MYAHSITSEVPDAIQDWMGPEQMQKARGIKYQRNKEGFCNKSAIKKVNVVASHSALVESNTKKGNSNTHRANIII